MRRPKTSRKDLLAAGFDLVWENGYHASSIKQIADKAEILVGSFYNYFPSKDKYVLALLDYYWEGWQRILDASLGNNALSVAEKFDKLFDDAIVRYRSKDFTRGCFAGMLCHEIGDTKAVFGHKIENLFIRAQTYYVKVLQQGQEQGVIDPKRSTEDMAEFIINSYEGALLRMKGARNERALVLCKQELHHYLFH